ncbi:polysaccharide biosynthesis/export family protein [Humitalea sp. 24SJ18S-53]|uniref:polysaccharide biosynthesis/export family protein n=1 Tax=Humitalea sp. 24SJ18S-53 TaxID=3422307 RepID=UPI003D66439D
MIPRAILRLCCLGLLVLAGCAPGRSFDQVRGGAPAYVEDADPAAREAAAADLSAAMLRGTRNWRLQPGDTIEVMYAMNRRASVRDYRIGIGDQIDVVFQHHPALNRIHTVRPDGRISLNMRGEINAAGMRPTDLGRAIAARYNDEYLDPAATVHVVRASDEAEMFMTMVAGTAAPRAQAMVIAPDGTIALPLLQSIRVSGMTVDEVAERTSDAYRQRIGGLATSVRLAAATGQQVFVFGEVQRPGPQPGTPVRSILQLVASAGGPTEFAALDQVRVLYWDEAGQGRLRVANLNNVLQRLSLDEDMAVPPGSVIYVPPSQLAIAGRLVDQIVRRLFLFTGTNAGIIFEANRVNLNSVTGIR